MTLRQRLRDFLLERRIRQLYRAHVYATQVGAPITERRALFAQFQRAVAERSPEAVLRMERRKGLA